MERLYGLVLELSSKAVVCKALSADDRNSFALACNCIAAEFRAASFHELCDLYMESIGTFVDEGEAEILFACFKFLVLVYGIICNCCHFLNRYAQIFTQAGNSLCDLFYSGFCIL